MHRYSLRLGLPDTNYNQLAEYLLMMQAGHFQWSSIAKEIGMPLSEMRTSQDGPVYATFFYIETRFPETYPIQEFKLDEDLNFGVSLRAFKNISVEGKIVFNRADRLQVREDAIVPSADEVIRHPYIRMGNVFISPEGGSSLLKVANAVNADFSSIAKLPNEDNPYQVTREAARTGTFGLLNSDEWQAETARDDYRVEYMINPDRDSNGAGLVYFANYFAFMDLAERQAMRANSQRQFRKDEIHLRALRHRRIGYYGNSTLDSTLQIGVELFSHRVRRDLLGLRYKIWRKDDNALICLSEAIKTLPATE